MSSYIIYFKEYKFRIGGKFLHIMWVVAFSHILNGQSGITKNVES